MLVRVPAEAVGDAGDGTARVGFIEGYTYVVEFDIANFFGEIDHERLLGWWGGGCRTGGCSSWSVSGCRRG